MKSRLVWKLSAVVVAILAGAIALSGYVNNLICAHFTLESARASLRFNSESIVNGIGQLMMTRNNEGIEDLFVAMSRGSTDYQDIRLVSHLSDHYGEVKASRFRRDRPGQEVARLELNDWGCATCHDRDDLGGDQPQIEDRVIALPEQDRVLSVMTPILNEPGCRSAACHAHAESPPILGFLNADYSLQRVDATATDRRLVILVTVLASLTLGIVALWFMFARLLQRPIGELIAGTQRIAANQFDFRFHPHRNDEIGLLEESFDAMTSTIQADRDELRSAKDYLEGMVENSADIIITVNSEGLIETFNHGGEEALGYRREEVIGERIESLYPDPRERERIAARLQDTGGIKNYETRLLTKDRQPRHVMLTLSHLRDADGNVIGTIGISKDITQEKRLRRELVQSQKFAAIGQAVTGIQHAVKNMLGSLKGGVYLVRNGMTKDNPQRVQRGAEMVEEGIERIHQLSHSMLNYAREWKPELQRVDLNDLIEKICELNRQAAADQAVTLRCEVPRGLPLVLCDPKLIHMAVTDLLANAIDACAWKDYDRGTSPQVVLVNSVTEDGDFFVVEVRDNGCGMNEEIKSKIFTPFFSTKEVGGTGLGLAMTARVISLHGGKISVESERDQGATFRLNLPMDGPKNSEEAVDGQAGSHN